jgi:hypothetical protein
MVSGYLFGPYTHLLVCLISLDFFAIVPLIAATPSEMAFLQYQRLSSPMDIGYITSSRRTTGWTLAPDDTNGLARLICNIKVSSGLVLSQGLIAKNIQARPSSAICISGPSSGLSRAISRKDLPIKWPLAEGSPITTSEQRWSCSRFPLFRLLTDYCWRENNRIPGQPTERFAIRVIFPPHRALLL